MEYDAEDLEEIPEQLLRLSKDLALIDDYEIVGSRVRVRQGAHVRHYSASGLKELLNTMLEHAPMLRKITQQ